MSTPIQTGWLTNDNGEKVAPRTLFSQVQNKDGKTLDTALKNVIFYNPGNNENIEVPEEGGTSIDVTAKTGQTIIVKEVDASGKPTKWEAADYQPKTHGMEYVTLVPESTVEYNEEAQFHLTATTEPLVVGADYLINFNGVEWNLPCNVIVEEGVTGKYIGTTELPSENGQPPFLIIDGAVADANGYLFIVAETTDPIILSIERIEYEQIPTKFIPSIEEQRIHDEVVISETTITDYSDDVAERWFRIPYFDPIIGSSYLVNIDGKEYRCVMNSSWVSDTGTQEIKFLIITDSYLIGTFNYLDYSRENYTCLVTTLDPQPESVTVSVTQAIEDKIPSRLIESNIDSITAKVGQTVIIKEVDANGKPTAWEAIDYPLTETEIIPQTTYTAVYNDSFGCYMWNFVNNTKLVAGQKYTVVFDGVKYTCTAKDVEAMGMNATVIGNQALLGNDTGEPFALASVVGNEGYIILMSFDGNEHTISLSSMMLDNNYLNLSWKQEKTAMRGRDVISETKLIGSAKYQILFINILLIIGESYVFTYNGVETICQCKSYEGLPYIGNLNMYNSELENSGENFLLVRDAVGYRVILADEGVTYRVQENFCYTPLPAEYMPHMYIIDFTNDADGEALLPSKDINDIRLHYPILPDGFNRYAQEGLFLLKFRDPFGTIHITKPTWNFNYEQSVMGNANLYGSFIHKGLLYYVVLDMADGMCQFYYINPIADETTSFILTSSTEGSTKKFQITVDDSGTLTATEVI